jgi:hypothetical protein
MNVLQLNFNNQKTSLSETDIDQLVSIIGERCRLKTVQRLRSILTYSASSLRSYGIFDRLIKDKDRWEYVAGQSYTDEIRTVRELILK